MSERMWDYGYANRRVTLDLARARECAFCNSPLFTVPAERFERETRVMLAQIRLCASCGWWVVYRVHQNEVGRTAGLAEGYSATVGCLVEFDVSDLSVPLGADFDQSDQRFRAKLTSRSGAS
jgi:hypothetical protein